MVAVAVVACVACGKEGPPLPPLHLVPEPVSSIVTRRTGNEVRFTFVLPRKNVNGPGAVNLGRVEIYAATVAAGAVTPPNRELLTEKNLSGKIDVRQPPLEGEEAKPEKPKDTRPGPGETVTFVEVLDEAKLTPTYTQMDPTPTLPAVADIPSATAPAKPVAATLKLPRRIYVIRGASRSGRPGQPAARIELPLGDLPPAPTGLAATFTESAVTLAWLPPVLEGTAVQYNVYQPDGAVPLNPAPLGAPAFGRQGVEFGKEECFIVRAVTMAGTVSIESAPSERACVTPADIFPPAAPRNLSGAPGSGFISLIWDANTEGDLAGYLVLRGEAPGDTLQPLTPAPIKETTFRDTTVKPGVRYVYAIVAVDTATPANASAQSNRVEETAR
jgi:hypothetical protein